MADKTQITNRGPLISVIIPCYDSGLYLLDAVDSVREQSYTDYEIIVVDDGSTDKETVRILNDIDKNSFGIKVLHQKNAGLSNARNHGVEVASGEYIVCLNCDDMLAREYLEKIAQTFLSDKNDKLGFVTTWVRDFGTRSEMRETSDYNPVKLLVENVIHAGTAFKKEAWTRVGGYKDGMSDGYDVWEFWISLTEAGYVWATVPDFIFFNRLSSDSALIAADTRHEQSYSKIIDLHKPFFIDYIKEIADLSIKDSNFAKSAIKEDNKKINNLESMVVDYKAQAASLVLDIQKLYFSRITSPAIKLRNLLLKARDICEKTKSQSVIIVKNITPQSIKNIAKAFINWRRNKRTVVVKNKVWPSSLPLITVVTPYYNQDQTVGETIQSVLGQTFKNFEYIIVNDGSKPEANDALLNMISDPRIRLLHHKINIGKGSPAAARNSGIEIAKGKYIVCLDSDDKLDPTYLEKCVVLLEANPLVSLATTKTQMFGHSEDVMGYRDYDPTLLMTNNMIITAAMFKREAWKKIGGYKAGIGYEDWEFWINQAEHGFFGKMIPEVLFHYRVASNSRYIEDKNKHSENIKNIESIHPNFDKIVKPLWRAHCKAIVKPSSKNIFVNLDKKSYYQKPKNTTNKNVLIVIPWMTFGGAETLIINFCKEIKDNNNISFITGLESMNEWEYKFRDITQNIYHLDGMSNSKDVYLEFLSNYITTRNIDILHIIHTDFVFEFLEEIKQRHPELKIILTMFNDRVKKYFDPSVQLNKFIDIYTTDNQATASHYVNDLPDSKSVIVIPNGIDCFDRFNPRLINRSFERKNLELNDDDLAVFFIGRLSEEKNPDVFLKAAKSIVSGRNIKNIKFFVVGDGPMRQQLEKEIKLIKNSQVTCLGYQENVERFLGAADVFVLPSRVEGFPLSILEAMSMKTVVIASDVGAVADVLTDGHDGFVVKPGSADDIVSTVLKLKKDKELLNKVKTEARLKLEKNYSNVILKSNYLKLYKDAMK